ncbi:MAG: hypothetical protein ACP5MV_02160 [Candidatus Parvarchaeum sp.]
MDSKDNLIDRIEEVKKKIAEFENNLNINSIDMDRIVLDKNKGLINQIEDYKNKIDNIEKEVVKSETAYPIEQEPLLSSKNISKNIEGKKMDVVKQDQPEIKGKDSYTEMQKTLNKVEIEKQEIENINDLLDKLKKNAVEQKKANAVKELKTIPDKTEDKPKSVDPNSNKKTVADKTSNLYIKNNTVNEMENYTKPSKVDSNPVNITENDLHSISELISRLDELLKSNKELADKLNELLKEQKADSSKTSRSDELIKKLAILGSNSNLS